LFSILRKNNPAAFLPSKFAKSHPPPVRFHGKAVPERMLCSITSDEMAISNALLRLQHPNMALFPKATSAPKPLILELVRTIASLS
jgi:hypothetical protein